MINIKQDILTGYEQLDKAHLEFLTLLESMEKNPERFLRKEERTNITKILALHIAEHLHNEEELMRSYSYEVEHKLAHEKLQEEILGILREFLAETLTSKRLLECIHSQLLAHKLNYDIPFTQWLKK